MSCKKEKTVAVVVVAAAAAAVVVAAVAAVVAAYPSRSYKNYANRFIGSRVDVQPVLALHVANYWLKWPPIILKKTMAQTHNSVC